MRPTGTNPISLRERLAGIYTHDFIPMHTYKLSLRIIRQLVRITGLSQDEIIAAAKEDAAAVSGF